MKKSRSRSRNPRLRKTLFRPSSTSDRSSGPTGVGGRSRARNRNATPIAAVMTRDCKTAAPGMLAAESLEMMEKHRINALLVVDGERRLLGALNMHDLLRAGVV